MWHLGASNSACVHVCYIYLVLVTSLMSGDDEFTTIVVLVAVVIEYVPAFHILDVYSMFVSWAEFPCDCCSSVVSVVVRVVLFVGSPVVLGFHFVAGII